MSLFDYYIYAGGAKIRWRVLALGAKKKHAITPAVDARCQACLTFLLSCHLASLGFGTNTIGHDETLSTCARLWTEKSERLRPPTNKGPPSKELPALSS